MSSQDQNKGQQSYFSQSQRQSLENLVNLQSESNHQYSGAASSAQDTLNEEDLLTQLALKDRDLILAAELGKNLLDTNEELKKKNEELSEEFNKKIELLNQEKHNLKLKLESTQEEYEITVRELHSDIELLRQELESHKREAKNDDKSHSHMVSELTQQNERLTDELKKVNKNEAALQQEVVTLREQVAAHRSSMHHHINQLELLRAEINMLTEKRDSLEERIQSLITERDLLQSNLEDSYDKILMLEKTSREQETRIRAQEKEILHLQERNTVLDSTITELESSSHSAEEANNSLFNELELSGADHDMNTDYLAEGSVRIGQQLKQEILEVYRQLQKLVMELEGRGEEWSPDTTQIQSLKAGSLLNVLSQLKHLVHDLGKNEPCSKCTELTSMEDEARELRQELAETQAQLTLLKANMELKDQDLQHKTCELDQLTSKMSLQHQELLHLQTERDRLQDQAAGIITKDDIVEQARGERDRALASCKSMDLELSKAKLDMMALDSNLREAIQQKLQLSQQLEAWQEDMQELIEARNNKQLEDERKKRASAKAAKTTAAPKRKFFFKWT